MRERALVLCWALLLSAGAAAGDYTYTITDGSAAIVDVPFTLRIDGLSPTRVSVMAGGLCSTALIASRDLDEQMSAQFSIDTVGSYAICVTSLGDPQMALAGILDVEALSFKPIHIFQSHRTYVTFDPPVPNDATFTINSKVQCDVHDTVMGPFRIMDSRALLLFDTVVGGFLCVTWPAAGGIINAGKVIVSEQFTFVPAHGLRYDDVVLEVTSYGYADFGNIALSQNDECSELASPTFALGGKWGVEAIVNVDVPVGLYFVCVEFPEGHYTPCATKYSVTEYTFQPQTLIANVDEVVTLEGSMAPNSVVTFHNEDDCKSEVAYGPLISRDYALNLLFVDALQYTVCVEKPGSNTRVRAGILTTIALFSIDGSEHVVRGVETTVALTGGSPAGTAVKLVEGGSCLADAVEMTTSSATREVTFSFYVDVGNYTVCVQTLDGSRWVSAGVRHVAGYTLGVDGAAVQDSTTRLRIDAAPEDGMNLTFVRRGALVDDACSEVQQHNDEVTVIAFPQPAETTVVFQKGGIYDVCSASPPSVRLAELAVSAAYTHLPLDGVLDTPIVLAFGGGSPRNTTAVLVPTPRVTDQDEANTAACGRIRLQPPEQHAWIDINGTAYWNLTRQVFNATTYTVCVDSKARDYIPTGHNLTLHALGKGMFTELIVSEPKPFTIDGGWPMQNIPSYTSTQPAEPVKLTRTWKVRVVRSGTSCATSHVYAGLEPTAPNAVVLLTATASSDGQVLLEVGTEEEQDPSLCVAIPVSLYLTTYLSYNATLADGRVDTSLTEPVVWLPVGSVEVNRQLVVEEVTWGTNVSLETGDIIRYVPFHVVLDGRESTDDLKLVLTRAADCGAAQNYSEPHRQIGTLNASLVAEFSVSATGAWYICLHTAEQWFQLSQLTAVAMGMVVDEVFSGYEEPRTLQTALAVDAGVSTVLLVGGGSTCDDLPSANILRTSPLDDEGAFNVTLGAVGGAVYVCGYLARWDKFVTIAPLRLLSLPTAAMRPPDGMQRVARLVEFGVEVSGITPARGEAPVQVTPPPSFFPEDSPGGGTWLGSTAPSLWVKIQRVGCKEGPSEYVPGGHARKLNGRQARFMLDLPKGQKFMVCVTYDVDYPEYYVPAGRFTMDGLFYPATFQANMQDTVFFRKPLPAGASLFLSDDDECDDEARRVPLATIPTAAANVSAVFPSPGQLCLQLNAASNTSAIGNVAIAAPFATRAPEVLFAGDKLRVEIPPDPSRHGLTKLAFDDRCDDDVPIPGGPQRIRAQTHDVTFDVPASGATGVMHICVMVADETNYIASGRVVVLNMSEPLTPLLCCMQEPQRRGGLPVPEGVLSLTTDAQCAGEVYSAPFADGAADVVGLPTVSVTVAGAKGLWVCVDGGVVGVVATHDPPVGTVPDIAYINNALEVSVSPPRVAGADVFVVVSASCGFDAGDVNTTTLGSTAVYVAEQTGTRVVCAVVPDLGVVHRVGQVVVQDYAPSGGGADSIEANVPVVVAVPRLEGRTWNASVSDAPCGSELQRYVFGPKIVDGNFNFTVSNMTYFPELYVCFENVYSGSLADVPTTPYGFSYDVMYDWRFWFAPQFLRAGDLTPIKLYNRAPGAKVFFRLLSDRSASPQGGDAICNATLGTVLFKGDSTAGNASYFSNSSTSDILYAQLMGGEWVLCVEAVPDSGVYVSAGRIGGIVIDVAMPENPTACEPMIFDITGLGTNSSDISAELRTGRAGRGECCSDVPELSQLSANALATSAAVSTAGAGVRATFMFSSAIRQSLLLCARTNTTCFEVGLLPDGFGDDACYTPEPTVLVVDPTDRRIGGAIDPLDTNSVSEGGLWVFLLILLLVVLLVIFCLYRHAWRRKQKKKGPVSLSKVSKAMDDEENLTLRPGDTWMTHVEMRDREADTKKNPTPYLLDRPMLGDISKQTPPRQGPGWYGADAVNAAPDTKASWFGVDATTRKEHLTREHVVGSVGMQAPPSSVRVMMSSDGYQTAHGGSAASLNGRDGGTPALPRLPPVHQLQLHNLTAPPSASPYSRAPPHIAHTPAPPPMQGGGAPTHTMADLYIVPPSAERYSAHAAPLGPLSGSRVAQASSPPRSLMNTVRTAHDTSVAISEPSLRPESRPESRAAESQPVSPTKPTLTGHATWQSHPETRPESPARAALTGHTAWQSQAESRPESRAESPVKLTAHSASPRVLLYGGQSPRPTSPASAALLQAHDADPLMMRRWEEVKSGARADVETDEERVRALEIEREEDGERFLTWEEFRKGVEALEMRVQQEKVDRRDQEEYEAQLRETERLKQREHEAERRKVDMRREEQQRAEQQILQMQEQLQSVEQRRQQREEAERWEAQRSAARATDNALLQEVQRGREERDEMERVLQQQAVDINLDYHRRKMELQKAEEEPRTALQREEDWDFLLMLSLHKQSLATIHDLRTRVQRSSEDKLRAEMQQRDALFGFEAEQRAAIARAEGEEHEQVMDAHREEAAKKRQVQELIKRQKALKEKQQRDEQEARLELDAERRRIESEKARIEAEKHKLDATRMEHQSRESEARSEALKRKAEQDQRLLEDNLLLAERASQARLTEERAREEIERERKRLKDEREAVEKWRQKVEDDARKAEDAADAARKQRTEHEARLEAERKHIQELWALQAGVAQREATARREVELVVWKSWDTLLANFQAGAADASQRQRFRESGERARARQHEMEKEQLRQLEADVLRSRRERLKDSAASVMSVLAALTGQEERR